MKANDRVFEELVFFKNKNVKKINILDPIFNAGKDYLVILNKMVSLEITSLITLKLSSTSTRFLAVKR